MNGKRPLILRLKDGSLPDQSCYDLCSFWAEEDEWDGKPNADYWQQQAKDYAWSIKLGLKAWVSSPAIENRLAEEEPHWKDNTYQWEDRMDYFTAHETAAI